MLVDKPEGITSHDVVQRVRRALRVRAAGHTGTLDPFATGLLVVLLGRATRLARFVESQVKGYLAVARLGVRTDTDDRTGKVLEQRPVEGLSPARIRRELEQFLGAGVQRPPVYSAKHVAGQRSYRLARRGETVEPAEVPVRVYDVEWLGWTPPEVTFRVTVSAGTYIRALARDLGDRLGVGGHLTALRRESIGPLQVEAAVPLEGVSPRSVLPPAAVVGHLGAVELDAAGRTDAVHGRLVRDREPGRPAAADLARLMAGEELVGIGCRADGGWQPLVVLGTP